MRVLSGIQPTGRFHWGNYFGAIRQYIDLQHNEQAFYFIADLHALTTIRDIAADTTGRKEKDDPARLLRDYTRDAAIDLLALGLNPENAAIFRQSDVPEVTELTWILLTLTQMSLLEKCHAFKDKKERGLTADAGLFTYPILMAADILLYDSDIVPVGVDQVQHIEVARDVAMRFNNAYGETLHLPQAQVLQSTAKVVGTDGEKMSKSYRNTIEIFELVKQQRKKIMSIVTDGAPLEAPKNPDTCSIFTLYKLFTTPEQQEEMAARYRAGGIGYGVAKEALHEAALAYFAQARERRAELEKNLDYVEGVLQEGAAKARAKGQEVLDRVRAACGMNRRHS